MLSVETINQVINLAIVGVIILALSETYFPKSEDGTYLDRKRRKSYLILWAVLFLGLGMLGPLGTDKTIEEGLLLKYLGNASLGYCFFYAYTCVWLFWCFRGILRWVAQYLESRDKI